MRKLDSKRVASAKAGRVRGTPKLVTVAQRVEIGLSVLERGERDQVRSAFKSWNGLRRLSKSSEPIGQDGTLRIADVSPHLYLVFRVTPDEAEVVDLMNKRAIQLMRQKDTPRSSK